MDIYMDGKKKNNKIQIWLEMIITLNHIFL